MKHGDLFLTDVKHRESVRQKLWPPYHALIGWDQCPLYQLAFHKGNVVYLDHRGEELARNWTRGHMFAGVLDARKSDKHREKYNVITVVLIGGASGGLLGCCDLYRTMSKLGHDHPHLEVTRHDVLKVGPQGWMTGATSVLRDLEEWGMIPTYTGDKSKCSGVGRRFVLFGISMGGGVIPQVGQEIVNRCGPDALLAQVHQCGPAERQYLPVPRGLRHHCELGEDRDDCPRLRYQESKPPSGDRDSPRGQPRSWHLGQSEVQVVLGAHVVQVDLGVADL